MAKSGERTIRERSPLRYMTFMERKILGGRYQIINRLGGGGFGNTFIALDLHLPNSPQCVVKQLNPQISDEAVLQAARRLFAQEAEVLYKLGNHDRIPRLFAHFEEDQEFYLVQEFIEGHELKQELSAGLQLSEAQVINILQDILEILLFVHQQNVIHRDIKSSNLIRRQQDGKLVLIDFGAVKQINTCVINSSHQVINSPGETSLTIPIGTPGYMPNEQLAGRPHFCSDIYAVGILGIQALTGIHPKKFPEDLNTSEIIWRDFVQVSPELGDLLDKMVRFDFRQRYQSVSQVLEDLNYVQLKISTATNQLSVLATDSNIQTLTTNPIIREGLDFQKEVDKTWLPDPLETVTCNNPTQPKNLGIFSRSRWQKVLAGTRSCLQVLAASVAVTALIMGVRYLGLLQTWELQAYDQMMRMRPDEGPDSRILVVTITEDDLKLPEQQQRKGSLSDRALALLLHKLESDQPQAIGLDIYHDFPVDSKVEGLATRLRRNNRFFAVCKVSDPEANHPGISPPLEVPPERQGFSDVVKDRDGIVRRYLIAMEPSPTSPCTTSYALSAQLAFHYLEADGISAKYIQKSGLQLGKVVFKRLQAHMGGYQKVDDWGYQTFLNYRSYHRSALEVAPTVTLTDILTDKVKPDQVKDRIILIGVTAQSAHDYVLTPYSATQEFSQEMPGVIVQAQMVSQILSAVQDGRLLLGVWPLWGEVLLVWIWSFVGGILVWRCQSIGLLGLTGGVTLGVLYGLCFGLFTQGSWVPLVPSALALVATGASVMAFYRSQTQ